MLAWADGGDAVEPGLEARQARARLVARRRPAQPEQRQRGVEVDSRGAPPRDERPSVGEQVLEREGEPADVIVRRLGDVAEAPRVGRRRHERPAVGGEGLGERRVAAEVVHGAEAQRARHHEHARLGPAADQRADRARLRRLLARPGRELVEHVGDQVAVAEVVCADLKDRHAAKAPRTGLRLGRGGITGASTERHASPFAPSILRTLSA